MNCECEHSSHFSALVNVHPYGNCHPTLEHTIQSVKTEGGVFRLCGNCREADHGFPSKKKRMIPMSYEEVALAELLAPAQTKIYVSYMRERFGDHEAEQCESGYAAEWACRFKNGKEWEKSDLQGQSVLRRLAPTVYA